MRSEQANQFSREDRLAVVLASCLEMMDKDVSVDRAALLARYPEFATDLERFFQDQEMVEGCAAPLRAMVGNAPAMGPVETVCVDKELGDFRILREVGRGGMGVVYEAEQISLRRRVALKVLPFAATMDPRHLQRFHNEAQAAACLHHTNIVPVFSVGSERGVHFYAMQFIDGQPLSEIIRRLCHLEQMAPAAGGDQTVAYQTAPEEAVSTPFPAGALTPLSGEGRRSRDYFRKVAELGVQAAEALDHAHQLGIVHRDIKPANLLLDGRDNLWVTDFGLAQMQQEEANLTCTGQMVGTPRYMSPEQAMGKRAPIDHRTDVYSLGVTLYELLTLRPAFQSEGREELLRQIALEEPPRPRRLERSIPAELEIIVLKAMEKRPQDRYTTAQELAHDLERWLRHEPIHARRPALLQRAAKWIRRHKPASVASAVVLLMGLLLAGYIAWTRHDRTLRREASEKVILAALKDSQNRQDKRLLTEALSAARRADGLLAGADVDEALQQKVRARRNDLELLDKLFHVSLEGRTKVEKGRYDTNSADARYGQTFREAGLDVETMTAQEAGEHIRRSTVAVELAAELDSWAMLRALLRGPDDPSWLHLLDVARIADPDPLRTRVRDTLAGRDLQALKKLTASEAVFRLPPATLDVLGIAFLMEKPASAQTEEFLRKAQKLYPNDFWINHHLYRFLSASGRQDQMEEVIRFATVTTALHPESPGPHLNLALALIQSGKVEEAIVEYREAIRIQNDLAAAHHNLGALLMRKDRIDEAIAEFREAIRIEPDHVDAHTNLGNALKTKGQLDESFRELREAVRLGDNSVAAHVNYGVACAERGRMDEAIAEFRRAIQLDNANATAHMNLGGALKAKNLLAEAIKEYRAAIQLQNDNSSAHYNLGIALEENGQIDPAIAEYRAATRLKEDDPEAHYRLGQVLRDRGRFTEALAALKRSHELGTRTPHSPFPTAKLVQQCERLVALEAKLPALLSGARQPSDASERLTLAQICQQHKKLFAAAARWYGETFAQDPKQADDLDSQHRYNAACAAAMAGCGQGKDADKLDGKERARLRRQALSWLRADLQAYRQTMEKFATEAGPTIAQRMQHWLQDTDFAGVRGNKALLRLPDAECKEWEKLWQEVEALRQRAVQVSKTANSAHP